MPPFGPTPRIAPVDRADATELQAELLDSLGPAAHLNLFRTLAQHPKLLRSWLRFGGRLLQGSSLPARDREVVILRVASRCDSHYEWGQHVGIARLEGLSDDEIRRAAGTVDEPALAAWDALLLRASDQLLDDHVIAEDEWNALAETYHHSQLIEFTMLVGHYAMLAGMLRSVRVQTEEQLQAPGEV